VFYIDVGKLEQDVANVAIVFSSVCTKYFIYFRRIFHMFHLDVAYKCILQAYVSSVSVISYVCCKCFIWILYMFCNGYTHVF
jgi:hypothetical protein